METMTTTDTHRHTTPTEVIIVYHFHSFSTYTAETAYTNISFAIKVLTCHNLMNFIVGRAVMSKMTAKKLAHHRLCSEADLSNFRTGRYQM